MGRAPCCEKVGLKKGRWSAEEDEILLNYIKANGEGSWRSLPKNAGLLRCGKSCRLRWINYLRDDIKRGSISKEEEEVIIKLHASLGNRWSLISGHLPGRTDNEIKNYWNSHLSRRIDTFRRFNHNNVNINVPVPTPQINSNERSGRTGRMKKKNHNPSTTQDMKKVQTSTTTTTNDNINAHTDHVHTIPSDNIDSELLQWFEEVVNGTDQEQEGAISGSSSESISAITCQRKELNEQHCLQELEEAGRWWSDLEMEGIQLQTEPWDDMLGDCWFGSCGSDSDFKPMQALENWLFSDMV